MLQLFSQETDLLIKVIMKCVNIKLWDILSCFYYILNSPRMYTKLPHVYCTKPEGRIHLNIKGYLECFITYSLLLLLCMNFQKILQTQTHT